MAAGPVRNVQVGATMKTMQNKRLAAEAQQSGFTLVEVMIAIAVMSVGLLAVVASIATAVANTQAAQEDLVARHKALEALESIYTARNSQQVAFTAINNTGNGGIFLAGPQSLNVPVPTVSWEQPMTCLAQHPPGSHVRTAESNAGFCPDPMVCWEAAMT